MLYFICSNICSKYFLSGEKYNISDIDIPLQFGISSACPKLLFIFSGIFSYCIMKLNCFNIGSLSLVYLTNLPIFEDINRFISALLKSSHIT